MTCALSRSRGGMSDSAPLRISSMRRPAGPRTHACVAQAEAQAQARHILRPAHEVGTVLMWLPGSSTGASSWPLQGRGLVQAAASQAEL